VVEVWAHWQVASGNKLREERSRQKSRRFARYKTATVGHKKGRRILPGVAVVSDKRLGHFEVIEDLRVLHRLVVSNFCIAESEGITVGDIYWLTLEILPASWLVHN